jgi:hypothetical protein
LRPFFVFAYAFSPFTLAQRLCDLSCRRTYWLCKEQWIAGQYFRGQYFLRMWDCDAMSIGSSCAIQERSREAALAGILDIAMNPWPAEPLIRVYYHE